MTKPVRINPLKPKQEPTVETASGQVETAFASRGFTKVAVGEFGSKKFYAMADLNNRICIPMFDR